MLETWCTVAGVFVRALYRMWRREAMGPAGPEALSVSFPATIDLTTHQRNALGSFLQVADDDLTLLAGLLRLARAPSSPFFSSNLSGDDIAGSQAACERLALACARAQQWLQRPVAHRWAFLVYGRLLAAEGSLALVLEGAPNRQQRQKLARLAVDLSLLKRRV